MDSLSLISPRLYKKICSKIPVLCVDLLIEKDGKYLLLKRKNNPLKGSWWVVGGRVRLGEDPITAANRKALEETGLKVRGLSFVGYYSDVYGKSAFGSHEYQTVSLVFRAKAEGKVTLDSQSSEYKWSESLPFRFVSKLVTDDSVS